MGYDVHITRADNWAENQGFEISTEEWLNLVQEDHELIPMPENGKYFVIWHGTTKYPETWFNWSNGNIDTKAPDKATFHKMLQIALKLNAKVQGDEGELYDKESIESLDDSFLKMRNPSKIKKINKFFLILYGLLIVPFFFFLIYLIIFTISH
jgi:hypothetical protein